MFGRSRDPALDAGVANEVMAREVALTRDLSPVERAHAVDLAVELVATKRWEGVGVELTPEVLSVLAGNAAIPILELGTRYYRAVRSIVVEPIGHQTRGRFAGPTPGILRDAGVVAGEAQANSGPVSLAWSQAHRDSRFPRRGRNLVIHELAHKIDMVDGYIDGVLVTRVTW